MKTNEAPEKLYLHPTAKGKVGASWLTFSLTNEDIEYTRTDAFITKACEWFRTLDDKEPPYDTTEEFIEAFKNAMNL